MPGNWQPDPYGRLTVGDMEVDGGSVYTLGSFINPTAKIGPGTEIWPGVYVGPNVKIGARCRIMTGARIGCPGFGYRRQPDGSWLTHEHTGGVELGDDVDVGANACIDSGTVEPTRVGRGTKIDNLVHVAHNCQIGEDCLIVALAEISGSTVIGDGCWIAPHAVVREHRIIGKGATVGLGAVVVSDVLPDTTVMGVPARER